MPFEKGKPKTGGRKKGDPNKLTNVNKEAISAILEGRISQLGAMIDEVRATNPGLAFKMMIDLMEFVVPKPKQMEITGADGKELRAPQIIFQDISGTIIKQ